MEDQTIDIAYVASLARLEIAADQLPRLQRDLEHIVSYIDELRSLDLEGVEPTAHAAALTNVWREDVAAPSFDREVMLANAPEVIGGDMIRVPQVLPGEGSN